MRPHYWKIGIGSDISDGRRSMQMHTIGVISDTHGLIRPEAIQALQGVEHILHAGDIGNSKVLEALRQIAPVTAVRGNTDCEPWSQAFQKTAVAEIDGLFLYLIHDLQALDLNPAAAGFSAVIHGHSHEARELTQNGVLYFNPGSAGPRRFLLPVTVGLLHIDQARICGEIIPIDC
jgi:putative phosphoesterase